MASAGGRRKIAILGGGVGAMTAAFELTTRPNWQDDYEVTVYQLGWRLGGKGASGRNMQAGGRIEEHGLHIWFGFYENAFGLIRRCYDERNRVLNRPPGSPLATWQDAFKPHSFIALQERSRDALSQETITFLPNASLPGGDEVEPPTIWEYVPRIISLMHQHFEDSPYARRRGRRRRAAAGLGLPRPWWWDRVRDQVDTDIDEIVEAGQHRLLAGAAQLALTTPAGPGSRHGAHHEALIWLLDRFLDWLWSVLEPICEDDQEARRLLVFIDLGCAAVRGLLRDDVIGRGFDALDGEDYRDWFRRHGAHDLSMASPWMWAFNDLAFAFEQGDVDRPNSAAGTTLRACLRMVFDYRGAFMWKMQAGMGDTIFAPLYEVLKHRGVKFAFFHRVTGLHPSADGRSIERISMARQATPKDGQYEPLVTVRDLACWPSAPLYEQLVEGEALKRDGINLESFWSPWPDVEPITLRRGEDFDHVVLGISLGGLPPICSELIALKPAWQQMIDKVKTVRTQAFQLWLKPTLAELGWTLQSPVMTTYIEPLDTWADMSQLIDREDWTGELRPGNVAYFCGPMADSDEPPHFSDPSYPGRIDAEVRQRVLDFLSEHVRYLWPEAAQAGGNGLSWDLLIDPEGRQGVERLVSQYWRANIDPSERYVLSVAGSTQYRLRSDQSGFDNLLLAGDWTRNGLNAGCVEAAVMSGMQASRAICGYPERIVGEVDRIEPPA